MTIKPLVFSQPEPVLAPVAKRKPTALFADQGFNSSHIDDDVRVSVKSTNEFTDIELARVTHIINHDLKNISSNQVIIEQFEKMNAATSKSNEMLLSALNTTIITDINDNIQRILLAISTGEKKSGFVGKLESLLGDTHEVDVNLIIGTVNQLIDTLKTKHVPVATDVIKKLHDVMYYANNDRRQLEIYHAAGEIKLTRSANINTSVLSPLQVNDHEHNINLLRRRVDNINTHVQVITTSLLQAQLVLHTLEHMLLDVTNTVLVSVPAYLQQLSFMNTMHDLRDSTIMVAFNKQRSSVIDDLTKIIKNRGK